MIEALAVTLLWTGKCWVVRFVVKLWKFSRAETSLTTIFLNASKHSVTSVFSEIFIDFWTQLIAESQRNFAQWQNIYSRTATSTLSRIWFLWGRTQTANVSWRSWPFVQIRFEAMSNSDYIQQKKTIFQQFSNFQSVSPENPHKWVGRRPFKWVFNVVRFV